MIKWRMRIASWIPKATNTQSECVIRINFPLHKWKNASQCYTYIVRPIYLRSVSVLKLSLLLDLLSLLMIW